MAGTCPRVINRSGTGPRPIDPGRDQGLACIEFAPAWLHVFALLPCRVRMFGGKKTSLALHGEVWRFRGKFGASGGSLALQGEVWRFRGKFGASGGSLAL